MAFIERKAPARDRRAQAAAGPLVLDRGDLLERLAQESFDVLVIGGGITGAYAAFDAALRGHRVALVEKDDFAAGTSSKSSKMIHGGLRYIEQGNLRLVRHSLLERQRLRENAGHLVQRLPFLFPIMSENGVFDRRLEQGFAAMLRTYDLAGGWREGILHDKLSRDEVLMLAPTLRAQHLLRGYMYYDARADDARLTLAIVRSALAAGAVALNHVRAHDITRSGGKVDGAVVVAQDGREIRVRAKVVVMATGSWLRDWSGAAADADAPTIRPAKGVHISVPWLKVRNAAALTIPTPGQKTRSTVTRWGDSVLVGTTDDDYRGDLDTVSCTADERDIMLRALQESFDVDVTADDVRGSIAGTRPLLAKADGQKTSEVSRSHEVRIDHDGLVSVVGGKLTTARHMAEQTVDAAEKVLGRSHRARTAHAALLGAAGYDEASVTASGGLAAHLAERYGTESRFVSEIVAARPDLARPIIAGQPYLAAEVVYAARHELADSVDDVLARRTRARLHARDASAEAAPLVADLLGDELGWDGARRRAEIDRYRAAIDAERTLLGMPASAPDTRSAVEAAPTRKKEHA